MLCLISCVTRLCKRKASHDHCALRLCFVRCSSPCCCSYGWLVSGQAAYTVRHGKRSQHACFTRSPMFSQGDTLLLSLDTRRWAAACCCIMMFCRAPLCTALPGETNL